MFQYVRQNKNVIMVAIALFFVSLSVLILFLGEEMSKNHDYSANVVDSIHSSSNDSSTNNEEQENEIKYRQIIDNKEDPIIVIGLDGMVNFASADFEVATGYEPTLMKESLLYEFIDSEDLAKFITAIGKVIENEETVPMVGPYKFVNVYGSYRIHIATLHPYIVGDKVVEVIIAFRDITDDINEAEIEADEYEEFIKKYFPEYFEEEEEEEKVEVPVTYTSKVVKTYVAPAPAPVVVPEPEPVVEKRPALEKTEYAPRIIRREPDFASD